MNKRKKPDVGANSISAVNTNRHQERLKATNRSNHDPYNWHLRSPFDREFDRSQWWKSGHDSAIDPLASLYELARRHPGVGQLRQKFRSSTWHGQELRDSITEADKKKIISSAFEDLGREHVAIHCLCLIGLKSWQQLTWHDKDFWRMSVGRMMGVDGREKWEKCFDIVRTSISERMWDRIERLSLPKGALAYYVSRSNKYGEMEYVPAKNTLDEAFQNSLAKSLKKNPISRNEIESTISTRAVQAYNDGFFLFAFAPDLNQDEAEQMFSSVYRGVKKARKSKGSRNRGKNWLNIISGFENAETSNSGASASGFNPYRKIMKRLSFVDRVKSSES